MWHWDYTFEIFPQLFNALGMTLFATLPAMLLAMLLGLLWTLLRHARIRGCTFLIEFVLEFIRGTPLLLQLYFFYYVLPDFGLMLPALLTGILALGLYYSAYLAEVYRAAISAIAQGQWDAARALNFSPWQTWRFIILPQALPPLIPVFANYWIAMFKDTPLLAAITVLELLQTAKLIGAETFRYLEPLTLVGVLFLAVSLGASAIARGLEKRYGRI